MVRKFLVAAAVASALSMVACSSTGKFDPLAGAQTPSQQFYAASAEYNAVLQVAVDYAKKPTASRAVVQSIANVNNKVQFTIRAGTVYFECAGDSTDAATVAACSAKAALGNLTPMQLVQQLLTGTLDLKTLLPQ